MDVNEELKFFGKFTKKKIQGGGGVRWGVKTLSMSKKKEKVKKKTKQLTEPGLEPTTSGLEIH